MLKPLVFIPEVYLKKEIEKLNCKILYFNDFNINNFYEIFLRQYFKYENKMYKHTNFEGFTRLCENLPLTTNQAEGYNSS
jgi:hypothetical protein